MTPMTMQISAGWDLWIMSCKNFESCVWQILHLETVGPPGLKCYSSPGRLLSEDCSIWAGNCWVKVRASDFAWNMCWVHVGHTQKLMGIGGSRNGGIPKWVSFVGWLGGVGCTEHRPRVPDDGRRSMSLLAPFWALGLCWVQPFKPRRAPGTKS